MRCPRGEQIRCAVQSWREPGLRRTLVEQFDVGDLRPALLEPGDNDPVDGFAQRDGGREIVLGDIDRRIHQPGLKCPVRQPLRVGQQFLGL